VQENVQENEELVDACNQFRTNSVSRINSLNKNTETSTAMIDLLHPANQQMTVP
jgi:hypothetical protein